MHRRALKFDLVSTDLEPLHRACLGECKKCWLAGNPSLLTLLFVNLALILSEARDMVLIEIEEAHSRFAI